MNAADRGVLVKQIVSAAPGINDREWLFNETLRIAELYLRWQGLPEASTSAARHQLEMVDYLDQQIRARVPGERALHEQQIALLASLNRRAALVYRRAVMSLPSTASSADYAIAAVSQLQGGDYCDSNAESAIHLLVYAYEHASGQAATFSRRRIGPTAYDRDRREVTASACGKFVLAFFAAFEPARPATYPSNTFARLLRERRTGRLTRRKRSAV